MTNNTTITCVEARTREIQRASWISIVGNALLAVSKISIGMIAGSLAVVGDGIDSSTDVVISFVTLFTARIMMQPPDKNHPYGHGRAETIATKVLSFIICFAGLQLIFSAFHRITEGQALEVPTMLALYITGISIIGKSILAYFQFKMGKSCNSAMLIANGKNMRNDILISSSVLFSVYLTRLANNPYIDLTVALLLGGWIIKSGVGIFLETKTELMDGMDDTTVYNEIFKAVEAVPGAANPHRARVRKIANNMIVDIDIEVDGSMTVVEAHEIAKSVEAAIKTRLPNVYDVIIHIEPRGNVEANERYGLTKDDIE